VPDCCLAVAYQLLLQDAPLCSWPDLHLLFIHLQHSSTSNEAAQGVRWWGADWTTCNTCEQRSSGCLTRLCTDQAAKKPLEAD
jgi:hypothetical protein